MQLAFVPHTMTPEFDFKGDWQKQLKAIVPDPPPDTFPAPPSAQKPDPAPPLAPKPEKPQESLPDAQQHPLVTAAMTIFNAKLMPDDGLTPDMRDRLTAIIGVISQTDREGRSNFTASEIESCLIGLRRHRGTHLTVDTMLLCLERDCTELALTASNPAHVKRINARYNP